MASSSFTTNLGLCDWAASDRPKRADFVSDNHIIDNALGGHIANTSAHLTAQEKTKALEPYVTMIYAGSGTDNRAVTTEFAPKLVMVYKKNAALTAIENGAAVINSGVAAYGHGGSGGVSVSSTGFVVRQQSTASGGARYSLNEIDCQYVAVAFR